MKKFLIVLALFIVGCEEKFETVAVPENNTAFVFNNDEKNFKSVACLKEKITNEKEVKIKIYNKQYGIMPGTTHEVPSQYVLLVDNNIITDIVNIDISNKNTDFIIKLEIIYEIEKENSALFLFNFKTKERFESEIKNKLNNELKEKFKHLTINEMYYISQSLTNYIFIYLVENYKQKGIEFKAVKFASINKRELLYFNSIEHFFNEM